MKRSRYRRSEQLFAAASRILPGGVDSPVRAFKSVGGTPLFIVRARGAQIEDADGRKYIDYVMSWGPLIHGHAPKGLLKALAAGGLARYELRRADRARDAARAACRHVDAVDGAHPVRELGDRGRDERRPCCAGCNASRQDHQVCRLLSRSCGSVSRPGGLGRDHAGRADESGRPGCRRCRHAGRPLQRPRLGSSAGQPACRTNRRGFRRAHRGQHGPRSPSRWISSGIEKRVRPRRHAARIRRGHLRIPGSRGRRAAALRRAARPHVPGQDHRRRAAGWRIRRKRSGHGTRRAGRTGVPGWHALRQSAGDDGRSLVAWRTLSPPLQTSCESWGTSGKWAGRRGARRECAPAGQCVRIPLDAVLHRSSGPRLRIGAFRRCRRVRTLLSGDARRGASIYRRRSSRRGSSRARTPRATSTRRSKRRGMR